MKTQSLRPGDIVDVVAPASRCSNAELKAGIRFIESLELVPRVPHGLFGQKMPLFANTDQARLSQLKKALYSTDSKMVWCVRGGYGSLRLMPEIRKWKRPARRKIFLGYSDITTLHAHLNQVWNWPTLHGPMVERAGSGRMAARERRALLDLIFGRVDSLEFGGLDPLNARARRSGKVRGKIVGGNMAVLQSALGTSSALRPSGRILFFEDIGEAPHRVDRMLSQFAQAGWFDRARAIVFGHFLLQDARLRRDLWRDVIQRFAATVKCPVMRGLPVGHDPRVQMPLPLNTPAVLCTGQGGRLTVDSGIE